MPDLHYSKTRAKAAAGTIAAVLSLILLALVAIRSMPSRTATVSAAGANALAARSNTDALATPTAGGLFDWDGGRPKSTPTPNYYELAGRVAIENETMRGELERQIIAGNATSAAIETAQESARVNSVRTAEAATYAAATARSWDATGTAVAPTQLVAMAKAEAEAKTYMLREISASVANLCWSAVALVFVIMFFIAYRSHAPIPAAQAAVPSQPGLLPIPSAQAAAQDDDTADDTSDYTPTRAQMVALSEFAKSGKLVITYRAFVPAIFADAEFRQFLAWAQQYGIITDGATQWSGTLTAHGATELAAGAWAEYGNDDGAVLDA